MARKKKDINDIIDGKKIGDKKEKKLNIDTKIVEEKINYFLDKYNLTNNIDTFIQLELEKVITSEQSIRNMGKDKKHYVKQFGITVFTKIRDYYNNLIEEYAKKELERDDFSNEEEKQIYQDIIKNMLAPVKLTMFNEDLEKVDLIVYHHLIKNLDKIGTNIIINNDVKKTKSQKNALELFKYELIEIIALHPGLSNFTQTIKSIIEQWLIKYNSRTKIGTFYFDILMITPEYIVEKVLRYIIFTAIKNMNPIYLRAIFSTYLTLIHQNLFSFYGSKLTKVKAGYFRQLESLFDENFSKDLNSYQSNPQHLLIDALVKTQFFRQKRFLKKNYEMLLDENSSEFLDINYFDALFSYKKDFAVIDFMFYYTKYLKATKNSFRSQSHNFKLDDKFFKKKNNALQDYTKDLILQNCYDQIMSVINDHDSTLELCKTLSQEIIEKFNPNKFLSKDFEQKNYGYDDYINDIQCAVYSLKQLLPSSELVS